MNERTTRGLVIIPAHNEEGSVASLAGRLIRAIPEIDVLVIDDGSRDRTRESLLAHSVDHVHHARNLGYVEALRTGLLVALEEKRPYVCFFDADGQHRVEDLQQMIRRFAKQDHNQPLDILIGSRFLTEEGRPTSMLRGFGNKVFCFILYVLSGRRFTDVSNGLKILSRNAAIHMVSLPLEDAHAELLLSSVRRGFRVEEHPVTILPREQGKSMITALKALWYPFRTLLALLVVYRRT